MKNIDSLSLVAFDNTCYLPSPSPSFQKGDISDGAWRWHLCDYATMGSSGWLSFVVPSAASLPESLLWSPPRQDPHSPVLESSTLHRQGQVRGSHCSFPLVTSLPRNILKLSSVQLDRGIALGSSSFWFNCHFRGHMKVGLFF